MRSWIVLLGLVLAALGTTAVAAAVPPVLVAPGSGTVRALVIGIDHYRNVNMLKGAVADARDIGAALKGMAAPDVTTLIDDDANRANVLKALDGLLSRSGKGDLILLTLAGHGSKEDERIKGSSPDGTDEVFLLVGFDPKTGAGGAEKILNHEFNHYIRAFEQRGAQVIFVADTCYGGGLAREVTPGGPELSYRQVPRYRLAEDDLKPVSTAADALLTPFDFERTTFLAAVDSQTKAPEVMINGAYRGALSYAMARSIEGAADEGRDGRITLRELFAYVRRVVYQLSDERQNVVTEESPQRNLDRDVVLQLSAPGAVAALPLAEPTVAGSKPLPKLPLKLATSGSRHDALSGIEPLLTPFTVVGLDADPDVVWDPVGREAIAGGDKIALDVGRTELPGVIDRTAAVRDLKALVVRAPQAIRVLPDASLHRHGATVEVEADGGGHKAFILVDITGSGVVQMLYPLLRDPPLVPNGALKLPFEVRDPYGADEVMAITAGQAMPELAAALHALDGRKSAGQVADTIARFAPVDARFGLVGLFTVP